MHLDRNAATKITLGLVMSHLDYENTILSGLPNTTIKRLQKVQNMASKVVLGREASSSATFDLKILHWLPIQARIDYKIFLLVFKCIIKQARTGLPL
jgi:hypothetical protein